MQGKGHMVAGKFWEEFRILSVSGYPEEILRSKSTVTEKSDRKMKYTERGITQSLELYLVTINVSKLARFIQQLCAHTHVHAGSPHQHALHAKNRHQVYSTLHVYNTLSS